VSEGDPLFRKSEWTTSVLDETWREESAHLELEAVDPDGNGPHQASVELLVVGVALSAADVGELPFEI
jgi:hypothetical protein